MRSVFVLRMGHRKRRDPRVSTHVALAARAFGAAGMFLSGEKDNEMMRSLDKVALNWGGRFRIQYVKSWRAFLGNWKSTGKLVHLTMYGANIYDVIDEIRSCDQDLLVVVGSQKVPRDLYEIADWNVSVTNQPHSEVSALAVFLHMLLEGKEFSIEFPRARISIIPSANGKKVVNRKP